MSKTYCYALPDISCSACAEPILRVIDAYAYTNGKLFTIESRTLDVSEKTLTITIEEDFFNQEEVRQELNQVVLDPVGYECQPSTLPPKNSWHGLLGLIGVGSGGLLLLLTLFFPIWSMPFMVVTGLGSTVLTGILGQYSFQEAYKKFFRARLMTMDTLFVISALTAVMASGLALFIPGWPMMFEAGLLMFGFRHLGLAMEENFNETIGQHWRFKSLILPEDWRDYAVGEKIIIQPGKILPVNGICLHHAMITETIKTGLLQPRKAYPNETLVAGMAVPEDAEPLYLQVTHRMEDSELARLDQAILKAKLEKTRLQSLADRGLQYFIPAVVILSLLSLVIVGNFWGPALAIQCMVAVLVSACPCVLGMIAPVMINIGLYKARSHGVMFQKAKGLEDAGNVDTVLFDMTGTLTSGVPKLYGEPRVLDNAYTKAKFLEIIGALETNARHTFGLALQFPTSLRSEDCLELANGRQGTINGSTYYVGDACLMQNLGLSLPLHHGIAADDRVVYLANKQQILGYVILRDSLKPEALTVVQQLKARGKRVCIVSGANQAVIDREAEVLGIDKALIKANCGPDEKLDFLKQLRNTGSRSFAMVGDGMNDALILSGSNLSIVTQSAGNDEVTKGQADVFCGGSLFSVLVALDVAEYTVRSIQISLLFNLVYNLSVLTIACGGLLLMGFALNPGIGAGLMILQSLVVFLHAAYFYHKPLSFNGYTDVPCIANCQGFADGYANETELKPTF